ncbi:hypothetical protein C8R43DRAFT_1183809 [Mycena crocata]|nr:hypothetical protein C8R43DRAFT_1183809 [Mycena crocata]
MEKPAVGTLAGGRGGRCRQAVSPARHICADLMSTTFAAARRHSSADVSPARQAGLTGPWNATFTVTKEDELGKADSYGLPFMPHMLYGHFVTDFMALTTLAGPQRTAFGKGSEESNSNVKMQPERNGEALGHRGTAYQYFGVYNLFLIPFHTGHFWEMPAHSRHTARSCVDQIRMRHIQLTILTCAPVRSARPYALVSGLDDSLLNQSTARCVRIAAPAENIHVFYEAGIVWVESGTQRSVSINLSIPQ